MGLHMVQLRWPPSWLTHKGLSPSSPELKAQAAVAKAKDLFSLISAAVRDVYPLWTGREGESIAHDHRWVAQ